MYFNELGLVSIAAKMSPMDWAKSKIVDPIVKQIKSGVTPEVLARSFAFGITCGLVRSISVHVCHVSSLHIIMGTVPPSRKPCKFCPRGGCSACGLDLNSFPSLTVSGARNDGFSLCCRYIPVPLECNNPTR